MSKQIPGPSSVTGGLFIVAISAAVVVGGCRSNSPENATQDFAVLCERLAWSVENRFDEAGLPTEVKVFREWEENGPTKLALDFFLNARSSDPFFLNVQAASEGDREARQNLLAASTADIQALHERVAKKLGFTFPPCPGWSKMQLRNIAEFQLEPSIGNFGTGFEDIEKKDWPADPKEEFEQRWNLAVNVWREEITRFEDVAAFIDSLSALSPAERATTFTARVGVFLRGGSQSQACEAVTRYAQHFGAE